MIITIIIMIVCVIFLFYAREHFGRWFTPFCVFNILWIVVASFILIGNPYVYEPSAKSQLCILIGIVGFNISMLSRRLTIGRFGHIDREYTFNYTVLKCLSVIVVIAYLFVTYSLINSLFSGASFAEIRTDYFTYSEVSNFSYYLRNYFLVPMGYVIMISTIIVFFSDKGGKSKLLLLNTIMIVVMQAIVSGGRYILMNTFFAIMCVYFMIGKRLYIKKRYKLLIFLVCVLLGYFIVFLTNDRSTYLMTNMSIWEKMYTTVYIYFSGSVTYLGEVIKTSPEIIGASLGLNFFAGFISPVFVILNFMHILSYPEVFNIIGEYACTQLVIGPYSYFNAMPTAFGYFYIDGGLILTFIEAWIFGYICKSLYNRSKKGNVFYVALFTLIFIQVCNSSTRWFLYAPDYALAFLYMRLLVKKERGVSSI